MKATKITIILRDKWDNEDAVGGILSAMSDAVRIDGRLDLLVTTVEDVETYE